MCSVSTDDYKDSVSEASASPQGTSAGSVRLLHLLTFRQPYSLKPPGALLATLPKSPDPWALPISGCCFTLGRHTTSPKSFYPCMACCPGLAEWQPLGTLHCCRPLQGQLRASRLHKTHVCLASATSISLTSGGPTARAPAPAFLPRGLCPVLAGLARAC